VNVLIFAFTVGKYVGIVAARTVDTTSTYVAKYIPKYKRDGELE
jgi:hypothetical protein